ncbi:phage major capsid protein [Shimia sagamensis]|uniref:Phage major capsid protein, HK97 family n=1 Tax=Shimia sagamensis TaxID=1566352 RepID=A0ABY1PE14_9RHOB|nr:phage major capsid protein [Shimia sagamensis]SMP32148.1 phage major capsid protein, HK97 family [Shimia sagamensis]
MRKLAMPAISVAALAATCPNGVIGSPLSDAGDAETMLVEVNQKLDKLNGEVKQTAETALKEAKDAGEVSAEVKQTADKLLSQQTAMNKVVEDLKALVEGMDGKVKDVSQQVAEGMPSGSSVQSFGQAAVAAAGDRLQAYAGGTLTLNVENAITTAAGSGGGMIFHTEERDPVEMARRQLKIVDLISRGSTDTDKVKYTKQTTRTDGTSMVAEQGTYGASSYGWSKAEADVRKIGHITHISEEAMKDAAQLQTMVDTELRYGCELKLETQVLAGDNTGENLGGLLPNATPFLAANGLPNATRIDRLRLAILQVALADHVADGITLNPTDWAAIELLKDGNGRFIWGNPGTGNGPTLWGKPVVESNSMSAGEWLVGAFKMAATLYLRSDVEVLISSEHGTNFVEDMLTMKGRMRAALAVKRPASLVTGDFTFV